MGAGIVTIAVIALASVLIVVWVFQTFLVICKPNEILVISGGSHRLADGSVVGYKVIHGGRAWRMPLIQELNRMDTRLIPVVVEVQNAFSKGGIPLTVHAIANVKITTDMRFVRNAIERCLTMTPRQIGTIAQQTLEGVLREVVAELTPEEVNEDRLKFASSLVKHATDDLQKIGLDLDVLKIQTVTDDQDYLKNLGRGGIARMIRDAENAENAAKQAIAEARATARKSAETAQKQAEGTVLTKRNGVRAELAKLESEAKSAENEMKVAAETARAEAEQEMQALRTDLERLRLEVEIQLPAMAARQAAEAQARGSAAPVIELGKAQAEALRLVAAEWQVAGRDGRDLYILQHLKDFVEAGVARVERAQIGELTVVDGGDGASFTGTLASFPAAVAEVVQQTARAVGVDMQALLTGGRMTEAKR